MVQLFRHYKVIATLCCKISLYIISQTAINTQWLELQYSVSLKKESRILVKNLILVKGAAIHCKYIPL